MDFNQQTLEISPSAGLLLLGSNCANDGHPQSNIFKSNVYVSGHLTSIPEFLGGK